VPNTGGTIYTYALTGSGNWDVDNNWSDGGLAANADPGTFAQNIGDTAIIGSSLAGTATITLNGGNRTLGYLTLDSAQNSTVTGNNLRFDVNTATAQLIKNNTGAATIASGIQLNDARNITRNGTGNLTVSGGITNNTGVNNLTLTDNNTTGNTTISGAITTGTGSVTKNGTAKWVLLRQRLLGRHHRQRRHAHCFRRRQPRRRLRGAQPSTAARSTTPPPDATTRTTTLGAAGGTFDTDNATNLTSMEPIARAISARRARHPNATANTYTGATNVNAGTLNLTVNNALADTTAVAVANGATFNVNGVTDTVGSITGAAGSSLALGAGTLTSGGTNASTTFAGVISGAGGS